MTPPLVKLPPSIALFGSIAPCLVALLAVASPLPTMAATATLSRQIRPVTAEEILGGALPGGFVHDFFVSAGSDLLSVNGVAIDVPLFQHTLGSDSAAPPASLLATAPALSADSFITMPGSTLVLGGGFGGGAESLWGDLSNDGPQENFHFARLTVNETGRFAGQISLRGYDGIVNLPFDFALPGRASDLSLLDSEPLFTLNYSLDPPPYVPPPTPPIVPPPLPTFPPLPPAGPRPEVPAPPPMPPAVDPPTSPPGTLSTGSIEFTRRSRVVTAAEAAGGAPASGVVHELFVTSTVDILSVSHVALDTRLFHDPLGSDRAPPAAELAAASPGVTADSFITTPGDTLVLGGGFDGAGGQSLWGDLSDDGPQTEFRFAQLTVDQTANFSGQMSLRGNGWPVDVPLDFVLPGSAADLESLGAEASFSLSFSLDPPVAPSPPPNPPVGPPSPPAETPPLIPPVSPTIDETPGTDPPVTNPPPEPGPRPGINVGYPILVELPDYSVDPTRPPIWNFPVGVDLPTAIDLSLIEFALFNGTGLEGQLAIQAFRVGGAFGATVYYASADAQTVHDLDGLEAVAAAAIARFAPPDNLVPEPSGGLLAVVAFLALGGRRRRQLAMCRSSF